MMTCVGELVANVRCPFMMAVNGQPVVLFAKRRQFTLLLRTSFALLCALVAATIVLAQPQAPSAVGPGTIFLVRHAERADTAAGTTTADPSLSDAGHARAVSLATLLKDARITTIFVTELKRTRETAAPLADALGIVPTVIAQNDLKALIARLRSTVGNVLVVGHSNTVPAVIDALGVLPPAIGDADFDNLFIVTPGPLASGLPPHLIRLHYR
jgi:phosphohistidine phosphatase SixA